MGPDVSCLSAMFGVCSLSIFLSWKSSLVDHSVESLPAIQETKVRSLGQEDPLDKKMATHSSILVWRIPRTEELGRLYGITKNRI